MFGHKSLPSRIWSYGANPPLENADVVNEQMFLAHRYRNALVEVELGRRAKVDLALRRSSGSLGTIDHKIAKADKKLQQVRDEINKDHVTYFLRTANHPEKVAAADALKAERATLYKERKSLRDALFKAPRIKRQCDEIGEAAHQADLKLRAKCGVYWGTYLHIEASMSDRKKGAPPRFKRWEGDGHLAIQIQKGMTVEEALSGTDTQLRIVPGRVEVEGTRTLETGIMRKLGNALCYFRIGSKGRDPIFAKIPFTMDRELPQDALIKWVHFIRYRVGTKYEWRLQFVVSQKSWTRDDWAEDGTLGIDLGWRLMPEGDLRVAVGWGTDDESPKLLLPNTWLLGMRQVDGIRKIRDENFNDAKRSLISWMSKCGGDSWLREEVKTIAQWHSQVKLASVVIRWRDSRMKGDKDILFVLEEWRKRDKHLYEFEANLRDQLLSQRESIYRNFAAELRRKYKTVKIKAVDRRKVHENAAPEKAPKDAAIKEHARDACLSFLERCLRESMKKTSEIQAKLASKIHHECGSREEPNPKEMLHTCSKCGEIYDIDENAAKNILYGSVSRASVT